MRSLTDDSRTVRRANEANELVHVERTGRRATVTMNDPSSLNALGRPLTARLHQALEDVVGDASVGAVVLTGTEPAFSAGVAPLWPAEAGATTRPAGPEPEDGGAGEWGAIRRELGEIARLIARSDKPFIGAVNGLAAGAGLALALACDVVVVSRSAGLDPASGRVGLLPEVGMSWLLTRRLGYHRALTLLTRERQLSATEAARSGLVDVAVGPDQLEQVVSFWCGVANLAATPDVARPLVRSATGSGLGRAAVMGEFAA
jgi:2-(1,2-epoxy-1,2-dihydrophenyl)acetyl-CoA isomerase